MIALRIIKSLIAAVSLAATMGSATVLAQETKDITFVIANPSAINILPVSVAIGEGYFAEEGLNVTVEALNGSAAVLQALSSGQAQIGNPAPGPFLSARARGVDVVFLYRLNPNTSQSMVVLEDSGIESAEDLRGKVIGIGTADGAEASFARSIFNEVGMVEGTDYTFLVVGDGGLATAGFTRGDIAAYVAATSDSAIMSARGLALRNITPEKFRTFFGNGIAAMGDYIEANPDVIEGFGRAVVKGARFAADPNNLEAVLDHTTAINPQESEDRAFAQSLVEQIIVRQTPFEPELGYGFQDDAAWAAWQDSLVESGDLETPLDDLEAAYTNDFSAAWNAE